MLSNKRKFNKKTIFRFWPFLAKKQQKLTKNEKKLAKSKLFDKISEIRYVIASQQKKIQPKKYFSILVFFGQKTTKIDKKSRKLTKSKSFDEIF